MPDQRIIDYFNQHKDAHSIENLKAALIKNGFPAAEVEEGAAIVQGQGAPQAAPPMPDPGQPVVGEAAGGGGGGDYVDFSPKNLIANAKAFFTTPGPFFARIDPQSKIGAPLINLVIWSSISGVVTGLVTMVKSGNPLVGAGAAIGGAIFMPIFMGIMGFVTAGVWHIVCKILGGQAGYSGSYAAVAGMAPLFPISSLLGILPFGVVIAQAGGLYFSVEAAHGVHKIPRKKAWIAFGILTALAMLFTVIGTLASKRLASQVQGGNFPGLEQLQNMSPSGGQSSRGPASNNMGQDPQAAMALAQKMLQGGGGGTPEQQEQMQAAMANAQRDGMKMLQQMGRFQQMAEPPRETLALLDSEGQAYLKSEWAALPGPIRMTVVQTMPKVRRQDQRTETLKRMVSQTANMNATMNQSMKMLQGMMQQQQSQ
jgi:hypothetical protein